MSYQKMVKFIDYFLNINPSVPFLIYNWIRTKKFEKIWNQMNIDQCIADLLDSKCLH